MLNKILSVVIVVMVTCSLVVQAKTSEEDVNLKKGLVLYMPLDEGKGASATDVSTNALEGAVKGKAKWIDGKFGKALQFAAASDHVLIGDNEVFHIENEITQAAWVKLDKLPGSHAVIFGTREGGAKRNIGFGYGMNPGNGLKVWTNGKDGGFKDINDNKTKLKVGQWYYVAYTHTTENDGWVRIFVDGTATHEEGAKNPVFPAGKTGAVQIGTWGGEAWPGAVDEVRLWNRALNDAEIKFSMQLGAKEFFTPVEPKNKLAVTWSQVKSGW